MLPCKRCFLKLAWEHKNKYRVEASNTTCLKRLNIDLFMYTTDNGIIVINVIQSQGFAWEYSKFTEDALYLSKNFYWDYIIPAVLHILQKHLNTTCYDICFMCLWHKFNKSAKKMYFCSSYFFLIHEFLWLLSIHNSA